LHKDWAAINNAQQVGDRWEVAKLYPIFTQLGDRTHPCRAASRSGGLFEFSGYHAVAHIEYLEPYSGELVSKLEAKFRRQDGTDGRRSEEAWQISLGRRWAVIDFKPVPEEVLKKKGLKNPMVPLTQAGKIVTETLTELRMEFTKDEN